MKINYNDMIEELDKLIELIDTTDDVAEFVVNANVDGYWMITTKKFFDTVVFGIMTDGAVARRGKLLKMCIALNKRIVKLNAIYNKLCEFPDISDQSL